MRLERVEPERVLALRSRDGNWVWTFVLNETDGATRLISRNRFRLPRVVDRLGMVLMEPASLLMERKMLLGIKQRAERLAARAPEASKTSAAHAPRPALAAVKLVHTLAWFSIEACMVYVLWAGFRRHSDRRAAVAAGVVGAETLIFAANGFRCPLTKVAERLGAERGSVTDIYLPPWFARNLPAIHVPLILLAGYLHRRNSRRRRGEGIEPSKPGAARPCRF